MTIIITGPLFDFGEEGISAELEGVDVVLDGSALGVIGVGSGSGSEGGKPEGPVLDCIGSEYDGDWGGGGTLGLVSAGVPGFGF